MKRPIVWALAFFCAGIGFARGLAHAEQYTRWICIALFFVLVLCVCAVLFNRLRWPVVFVFAAFAMLGLWRTAGSLRPPNPFAQSAAEAGEPVGWIGVVTDVSDTDYGASLTMDVKQFFGDGFYSDDTFHIKSDLYTNSPIQIGDIIHADGKLAVLLPRQNPGGFDEYLYYKARGIDYRAQITTFETIGHTFHPMGVLYQFRNHLAAVYDAVLPAKEAGILKSVLLGDKSGLDEDIKILYRIAGIYHILCVSGLHMSVLSFGFFFLFSFFLHPRAAGILTLLLLAVYCLMTGASAPTVRAVLMSGVVIAGGILFRDHDLLASISFACIVLLLRRPLYLWDIGFQLSFSALFGIAILSEPLERVFVLLSRIPGIGVVFRIRKLRSAASGNLAAILSTAPALWFHFAYVTPYAFFVNLIVLPLASFLVILGAAVGLSGVFSLPAATFLSGALFYLLRFYELVCTFFVRLPFAKILTGSGGLLLCALGYGVLVVFWRTFSCFDARFRRWRNLFALCMAVFVLAVVWKSRPPSGLEVVVPDVGAGNCAVIRYAGNVFIWDDGRTGNSGRVLLPLLDEMGISTVDGIIVPYNARYTTGVSALLDQKQVKRLLMINPYEAGTATEMSNMAASLIQQAKRLHVLQSDLREHDALTAGDMQLTMLRLSQSSESNLSNRKTDSLVPVLSLADFRLGFVGQQVSMAKTDTHLAHLSVVLCGPMDAEALDALRPAVVLSDADVNTDLHEWPVTVYNTAKSGAVTVWTDGTRVRIVTER